MSQIFLSYSSNDRERVLPLVRALQEDGYTVWWDREIRPGPSFDREIEREITDAGCIVVVWSQASVDSEWVRAEVEEGARRGLLVPVMIDDVLPPLAHRRRQAANLTDWDGDRDGEYAKLVSGIEATLAGEQPIVETAETGTSHAASSPRRRRRRIAWPHVAVTAFMSLVVGAGLTFYLLRHQKTPPPPETQFEIQLPGGVGLTGQVAYPVMITPDGRTIAFNGTDETGTSGTHYFARRLGKLGAHPVEGIESRRVTGLGSLWRGPEGEWFIYNDPIARAYKKDRITGGTPITIASTNLQPGTTNISGLDWGANGDIVFSNSASHSIMILKGGAGTATALTHPPDDMVDNYPHFTPDGRAVVYAETKTDAKNDKATQVMVMDLASGKAHALLQGDTPRVTTDGHLLFRRQDILWASAFDAQHLEVYGKQVPILEGLAEGETGWDIADNGTLVYVPAAPRSDSETHLVWLSTGGKTEPVPSFQHNVLSPALSPDDSQLAVTNVSSDSNNGISIWLYSFGKQIASRLTFTKDQTFIPSWSPDGKWIVYEQAAVGVRAPELMLRAADGTGDAKQLTKGASASNAAFTPDGQTIVFSTCEKQCDLAEVRVSGKTPFKTLLKTPFNEVAPKVSPDGHWIAYASNDSGQDEVFVRPWPDVDSGRWQVSTNGGDTPVWSQDGATLFYVEATTNTLMSVAIGAGKEFSAGRPAKVADFSGYRWQNPVNGPNFAVSKDGKRFLVIKAQPDNKIVVVENWLSEVERLVPTKK